MMATPLPDAQVRRYLVFLKATILELPAKNDHAYWQAFTVGYLMGLQCTFAEAQQIEREARMTHNYWQGA